MKKLMFLSVVFLLASSAIAQIQPLTPVGYFNPRWSPDGSRISFDADKTGKFAIYTIKTDGTDLRKLTGDDFNNTQARWSPDGKQIVFQSARDGRSQIYIMNADGTGHRRRAMCGNWIISLIFRLRAT